jgi:hypothetical protein
MQKHVLLLTTSAVMLAWGTIAASAQAMTPGGPMTPQEPQTLQQQLERQLQGIQTHAAASKAIAIKMTSRTMAT